MELNYYLLDIAAHLWDGNHQFPRRTLVLLVENKLFMCWCFSYLVTNQANCYDLFFIPKERTNLKGPSHGNTAGAHP